MIQAVPIETAKLNLDSLVRQLHTGDTITLTSADGETLALLVRINSAPKIHAAEWQMRWDALVKRVSRTWQSDKSALEILREMRR